MGGVGGFSFVAVLLLTGLDGRRVAREVAHQPVVVRLPDQRFVHALGQLRVGELGKGAREDRLARHLELPLAERLALVNRQLNDVRRELDRLVRQLAEATPADASTEDEPASSTEPPDGAILLSLPGIGTGVLATLLAEASDAVQRRDYDALRCLCGVAPVTRRSGKSLIVTRRLATHERLRDAAYHWARVAAQRDPVSHAKYQALRTRGHGHARALRSVADRACSTSPARCCATASVSTRTVSGLPPREPRSSARALDVWMAPGRRSRPGR